jgi:hypothetical protein
MNETPEEMLAALQGFLMIQKMEKSG